MLRNISAVVSGLAIGMAVNMGVIMLHGLLYPMPEGLDFADQVGMAKFISSLPLSAMLLIMMAHLGQSFFGAWVAALISKDKVLLVAMIVGALSLLAGIINMMSMPLPSWMMIEFPLYLLVAWSAALLENRRRAV